MKSPHFLSCQKAQWNKSNHKQWLAFAKYLLCARHRAKFFSCSSSYKSQGNSIWQMPTISPFYRWRSWSTDWLKNLLKFIRVSELGCVSQEHVSRVHIPNVIPRNSSIPMSLGVGTVSILQVGRLSLRNFLRQTQPGLGTCVNGMNILEGLRSGLAQRQTDVSKCPALPPTPPHPSHSEATQKWHARIFQNNCIFKNLLKTQGM